MVKRLEVKTRNGAAYFDAIEGEVINQSQQRWSETHVYSTGGGGQHGGYISAPTIHSNTSTHHLNEFWIREDDGIEHCFQFQNCDFAVAAGQRVRLACTAGKTKPSGEPIYAYNFNSKIAYDFLEGRWLRWAKSNGLIRYPLVYRLIVRWIPFILFALLAFFAPNLAVPEKSVQQHIKGVVGASLQNVIYKAKNTNQIQSEQAIVQNLVASAYQHIDITLLLAKVFDPVRAMQGWMNTDEFWAEQGGLSKQVAQGRRTIKNKALVNTVTSNVVREREGMMTNIYAMAVAIVTFGWFIVWPTFELFGFIFFAVAWRRRVVNTLRQQVIRTLSAPL